MLKFCEEECKEILSEFGIEKIAFGHKLRVLLYFDDNFRQQFKYIK